MVLNQKTNVLFLFVLILTLFILSCNDDSISSALLSPEDHVIGVISSTSNHFNDTTLIPISVLFTNEIILAEQDSLIYFDASDVIVSNANLNNFLGHPINKNNYTFNLFWNNRICGG